MGLIVAIGVGVLDGICSSLNESSYAYIEHVDIFICRVSIYLSICLSNSLSISLNGPFEEKLGSQNGTRPACKFEIASAVCWCALLGRSGGLSK